MALRPTPRPHLPRLRSDRTPRGPHVRADGHPPRRHLHPGPDARSTLANKSSAESIAVAPGPSALRGDVYGTGAALRGSADAERGRVGDVRLTRGCGGYARLCRGLPSRSAPKGAFCANAPPRRRNHRRRADAPWCIPTNHPNNELSAHYLQCRAASLEQPPPRRPQRQNGRKPATSPQPM